MRKLLERLLILILMIFPSASIAGKHDRVTVDGDGGRYIQCMKKIGAKNSIPFHLFYALAKTEGGWIGLEKKNSNGTYDLGLMQINTIWLKHLVRLGITRDLLKNNGCANILASAVIFRYERKNFAKGNDWDAVGHYHSKVKRHQLSYKKLVSNNLRRYKNKVKAYMGIKG